jgi:hypothetical protein
MRRHVSRAESKEVSVLREAEESYEPVFGVENRSIRAENTHFWDI